MEESDLAAFYSKLLKANVTAVYHGVPIIEVPSIEDLARRDDWPEIRASLRSGLRDWAKERGLI